MKSSKYILIVVLALIAGVIGYTQIKGKQAKNNVQGEVTVAPTSTPTAIPTQNYPTTVGSFFVTDKETCLEKDKPLVYFYGSSTCPHCIWEKPIIKEVTDKFKTEIVYHENIDNQKDMDVFQKYADINPGYVPFLVFGCKYVRVGAGEQLGTTEEESTELEKEALTAVLCKLTGDKPASVCSSVKNKVQ